jgi:hypothetical protein
MKTTFNPWPYGIIAFFILLFCGLATVVVIAATHRDSLVSGNYYEQEIHFQNHIDGVARAQQAGATLAFDAAASRFTIALPVALLGSDLSGQIELYRPSAAGLDQRIRLQPDARGAQTLDLAGLTPGLWVVRVSWNRGKLDYFLDQKIVIAAK